MKNKISIFGLWHLGSVMSVCLSDIYDVIGYDPEKTVINNFQKGNAPIYEPGLDDLIKDRIKNKNIQFTNDLHEACNYSNTLWITYDVPVDNTDAGNHEFIIEKIRDICRNKHDPATVIISSQIIATTCSKLEKEFPHHIFVYIPENLRLGKALESFYTSRLIIGCRKKHQKHVEKLLDGIPLNLIFMSTESAEMVKHSLNSFLALSVSFINEIAKLCTLINADPYDVSLGLKTDERIGKSAYLTPGEAFSGGTLARDIVSVNTLSKELNVNLPIISSIKSSNDDHKNWHIHQFKKIKNLKNVLILGLTYTENTNVLRRSTALEFFKKLKNEDCKFYAYDPLINELVDPELKDLELVFNLFDRKYDAVFVFGKNKKIKDIDFTEFKDSKEIYFVDANKYLYDRVENISNIKYISVGFNDL